MTFSQLQKPLRFGNVIIVENGFERSGQIVTVQNFYPTIHPGIVKTTYLPKVLVTVDNGRFHTTYTTLYIPSRGLTARLPSLSCLGSPSHSRAKAVTSCGATPGNPISRTR